jgi:hypothetical protein
MGCFYWVENFAENRLLAEASGELSSEDESKERIERMGR